jgi:hypothetical protein
VGGGTNTRRQQKLSLLCVFLFPQNYSTRDENRKIKKNDRTEKRGFGKIQRKREHGEREGWENEKEEKEWRIGRR